MARTATAIKANSLENTADIHHLVLTVAATNSPDQLPSGALTGDQADERIRTWLENGDRVAFAEIASTGDVNGIFTVIWGYLLVKD